MKNVVLIMAMLLSKSLFATGNEQCSSNEIKSDIVEMISHQTPFTNFDLEGIVTIEFTIDEDYKIHITKIITANTFLADHVLESVQNKVVACDCAIPGTVYAMRLQYVQYS